MLTTLPPTTTTTTTTTVGGQSLAITKPHLFLAPHTTCEDIFSDSGLIQHTVTVDGMLNALTHTLVQEEWFVSKSSIINEGIPMIATTKIQKRILELLGV